MKWRDVPLEVRIISAIILIGVIAFQSWVIYRHIAAGDRFVWSKRNWHWTWVDKNGNP